MARRNWSQRENELTVRAYFEMLDLELRHAEFNKAERNRALLSQLDGRSRGAIELKHMNISAILRELGGPSIDGYKPLPNYQESLASSVVEYLNSNPELIACMDRVASMAPAASYATSLVDPNRHVLRPEPLVRERVPESAPLKLSRAPFDYAERDAANRKLGEMGERFVVNFERARLKREGRDDLAARVEWSSKERGDGLGYDVTSFHADESPILIEVKTTNLGLRSPFIISPNEVEVSERERSIYRLYRVFRFAQDPRFFELIGSVRESCKLLPRSFTALVGA